MTQFDPSQAQLVKPIQFNQAQLPALTTMVEHFGAPRWRFDATENIA